MGPERQGPAASGAGRGAPTGGGEGNAPTDMRDFGEAPWMYGCVGTAEYRPGGGDGDTAMPQCSGVEIVVMKDGDAEAAGPSRQPPASAEANASGGGASSGRPSAPGPGSLGEWAAYSEKFQRSSARIVERMGKNMGWAANSLARAAEGFWK